MPSIVGGLPSVAVAPATTTTVQAADAAVVTPPVGPSSQDPPKPIVLQNAAVGLASTIATNTLTSGATGTPEILWLAALLNTAVQAVKQHPRFNEKLWTIPFLLVLGISLMCWYYRDPQHWDLLHFWEPGYLDIPSQGVLKGGAAAFQSLANYKGLAATGASPMQPTPFAASMEARA